MAEESEKKDAAEPEKPEPRKLYEISRSKLGPRVVKLTLPEGAWELVRKPDEERGELGSVVVALDDFTRQSIEAKGHFELKKAQRRPAVAAIPRVKPPDLEEVKN